MENMEQTVDTGSEPLLFDDMSEDTFAQESPENDESENEGESQGETQETEQEPKTDEKTAKEETSEEKADNDSKEAAQKEEEPAKAAENRKVLKLKDGDKEIELPLDSKLTVSVDGKEEEVSVQELRDNYSGRVAWDKKFTELSTDRKAFEREKFQANETLKDLLKTSEKDAFGLIAKIADHHGEDPIKYVTAFRKQLMAAAEEYYKADESERRLLDLQFERDFYKTRKEADTQSENEQTRS